ncbi:hypothetical protein BH11CYA1_BH11CYA1_21400 [soil metagenome]
MPSPKTLIESESVSTGQPPDVEVGFLRAYFTYSVADSLNLDLVKSSSGKEYHAAQIKLADVPAPSYIQFAVAPLVAELPAATIEVGEHTQTAEVRLKLYDYGTVALRFSFPFSGTWQEFTALSRKVKNSEALSKAAQAILTTVTAEIAAAISSPQKVLLEDYFVAEVQSFVSDVTASQLLQQHRSPLASLVAGEVRPLALLEQDEVLRVNFSYMECELAILTWDLAFVFDNLEGANTVDSIIEFANTQLVELRTYDSLLDRYLDEIYKSKAEHMRSNWLHGGKVATRQAERLRYLLVDVRELSDRASNALKMIGDAYYARLYRGMALRLSLSEWQHQVETKLTSVGEIYRFTHDQAEHGRSEFLEFMVIALISIEILMNFWHH